MLPRCTSQRIRILPAALIAALILIAVAVGACGGEGDGGDAPATPTKTPATAPSSSSPSPAPSDSPAAATRLSIYFLRGDRLGVAERRVPHTKAVATAAMRELCIGPSASERAAGLATALPSETALRSISISDGVALVDLSSAYDAADSAYSMNARIAQVVYTLTQFPSIKAVDFSLDGVAVSTLGGEVLAAAQRRSDWVGFEPAIFAETPGVGAALSSPFVLSGTASVYEGTFLAELHDDSGLRIARAVIQASLAGPERGDFRKTVEFTTAAKKGTLTVYDRSMEDGSRRDEVQIPVTFTP